jgi:general secretion pathway protein D
MLKQNMMLKWVPRTIRFVGVGLLLADAQTALAQAAGGGAAPAAKVEPASDRTIPVRTGAGTLNKTGKPGELKAGGGTGVLKRGKGSLDPNYDPAEATKKLNPKDEDNGGGRPNGGGDKGLPSVLGGGVDSSDKKLPEDIIKFTANFGADIRCKKIPASARVTMDFQDAPIEAVTKLLSCWTNRNIMIDTQKKGGKITILSPQPVSVYEAYRAFLSALAANGLTMTQKGSFYHIVDNTEARAGGATVLGRNAAVPSDDNIVTRLIKLKNIDAKDVEALAGKFKSKAGDVFVYPPNNTLIITDTGTNIQRIMKLLADVDLPLGAEKIWIRPVQHMDAGELVEKITSIFDAGGKGAAAPAGKDAAPPGSLPSTANKVVLSKVIADDRSNQIIIIASRTNYLKADALIRKLDVPIPGEGGMHICHLENADAEDVSQALSGLTGGGGGGGGSKKPAAGGAKPAGGGGAKSSGPSGPASLFEGDVKITAYKQSNSLIVQSSLKDYLALQKIVAELDRRRKQVYVEAVIMEISTSKNRKVQLAGSAGTTFDIGGSTVPLLFGLGGLGMGGIDLQQLNAGGFGAGMQGPLLNVNAGNTGTTSAAAATTLSIPAFGFLIQAIQENSDVNVLSTPSILTLNNEDAEITVGRKIPYRSQSMGGMGGLSSLMGGLGGMGGIPGMAGGLGGLGAMGGMGGLGGMMGGGMVQHLDVDLTLKITPQINESDFIKLKIDESLNEVEGIDPNLGPTTSKRKVSNTVVVRDQQPVVIGGLVTDRETSGMTKVPILGDLPLIGMLFRKTTKLIEKKNLMLIIVPHIIKDPSDLERMHETKMAQIREFADELATKRKEYEGKVDFRKKKGFLESMFQSIDKAATERKMAEKAYFDNMDVDKVGSPDSHDLEHDDFQDKKEEEAPDASEPDVIELPAGEGKPSDDATTTKPEPKDTKATPASKTPKGGKGKAKGKAGSSTVIEKDPTIK